MYWKMWIMLSDEDDDFTSYKRNGFVASEKCKAIIPFWKIYIFDGNQIEMRPTWTLIFNKIVETSFNLIPKKDQ